MANESIFKEIEDIRPFLSQTQWDLIQLLEAEGPMKRRDIMEELGLAWTTTYDNLEKLQKRELVEKFKKIHGRGRPYIFWKIKEEKEDDPN